MQILFHFNLLQEESLIILYGKLILNLIIISIDVGYQPN